MNKDALRRYRCKYEFTLRYGKPFHLWSLLGARGGLHLHITDNGEEHAREYGERYHGGIEIHHRTPPDYMQDTPPTSDDCWLIHSPCWHDGSSLQASERWIPLWQTTQNDHEYMFRMLAVDADQIFTPPQGEESC